MLRVEALLNAMFPGDDELGWPGFSRELLFWAKPHEIEILKEVDKLIIAQDLKDSDVSVQLLLEKLKRADASLTRSFCELSLSLYFGADSDWLKQRTD